MRSNLANVSVLSCLGFAACAAGPRAGAQVVGIDPTAVLVNLAPRAARTTVGAEPRLPKEGDRVVDLRAFYGIPILQRSFFWDGNGEVDTFGVKARHLWFTSDHTALGAGLTLANFLLGGADEQAAEVEAVGRFYVHSTPDWAVFVETTGGYMQGTDALPPGGTEWNFTFSFGPGLDIPIGDGVDLVTGVTYHHMSNALGHENPRNPSQNEAQIWIGMDIRF